MNNEEIAAHSINLALMYENKRLYDKISDLESAAKKQKHYIHKHNQFSTTPNELIKCIHCNIYVGKPYNQYICRCRYHEGMQPIICQECYEKFIFEEKQMQIHYQCADEFCNHFICQKCYNNGNEYCFQ